jgi:hypothetical protein
MNLELWESKPSPIIRDKGHHQKMNSNNEVCALNIITLFSILLEIPKPDIRLGLEGQDTVGMARNADAPSEKPVGYNPSTREHIWPFGY